MLKVGWDVNNVSTIVGLRAYASHILPEQTLGRGLRRMYFGSEIKEELDVIGTDPFIDFVKKITIEGVELEEVPMGPNDPSPGPIVIEVDVNKNIDELDFEIPVINSRYSRDYLSLDLLNPNNFNFVAMNLKKYEEGERNKNIIFRDLLSGEKAYEIKHDSTLSIDSSSVIGFFTETISKELRLVSVNHFIYEKVKLFIENLLFGEKVEIISSQRKWVFCKTIFDSYEGCLSVPNLRGIVKRHTNIQVDYYDEKKRFHSKKMARAAALVRERFRIIYRICKVVDII